MQNKIKTAQFGEMPFGEEDVIAFPRGLPGFKELRRFLLLKGEGFEPFHFLQSLEQPAISFPLLDPGLVISDYKVPLTRQLQEELELAGSGDHLVYCIVTLAPDPKKTTVNLFAPLVINSTRMLASQIVLFDSEYAVDQQLLAN